MTQQLFAKGINIVAKEGLKPFEILKYEIENIVSL